MDFDGKILWIFFVPMNRNSHSHTVNQWIFVEWSNVGKI